MRCQFDSSPELWLFRTGARILLLGWLAWILAVAGIYGFKAYTVMLRTREIGIRMALGASIRHTLWNVPEEGLWLIATGACIGLALSLTIGRLLSSLLFKVSALDPLALPVAPVLLASAALLATWFPVRRAARISPLEALRSE